jgi:hypothetical protein
MIPNMILIPVIKYHYRWYPHMSLGVDVLQELSVLL